MPVIEPNEVVQLVISDDALLDHLRRCEHRRVRMGFRDFLANFGIYDLGELSESQAFAFVSARNTAQIIDLLRIPRGRDMKSAQAHASYDLHRRKTSLGPAVQAFVAPVPSSDRQWEIMRDPEDIPEAIPEDLLLRRLAPKEFLRRLTEGELIKSAWIQEEDDEQAHKESPQPDESFRQSDRASADQAAPYGYLLVDCSESMGSGRDRRGEVAKGLALAFLLSQYEAGNPTYVYLFRHELSPQIGGEGRVAFESAVAAVLTHSYEGMTSLQSALGLLSEAKSREPGRVDIALITDGVTRLTDNPLGDSHLHTFLVGLRPEEFDRFSAAQYQESMTKLRHWSDFTFGVDPEVMVKASVPSRTDLLDLIKVLHGIEEEFKSSASVEKVRRIQGRLHNLRAFFARYREYSTRPDEELQRAEEQLADAIGKYGHSDPVGLSMKNAEQWSPLDRDLMISLETRELRPLAEPPTVHTKWSVQTSSQPDGNPFEALVELWRALARGIRRILRKRKRLLQRR
jgi:hypothetical protein